METQQNRKPSGEEKTAPAANTGNASNPSPEDNVSSSAGNQLLNEKAEKYLREVASIEDVPDAADQQEMEETLKERKKGA